MSSTCNLRRELIPLPVWAPDLLGRHVKHKLRNLGQRAGICILLCRTGNTDVDLGVGVGSWFSHQLNETQRPNNL